MFISKTVSSIKETEVSSQESELRGNKKDRSQESGVRSQNEEKNKE